MSADMEQLYAERLNRYVATMRNMKPDRIPIRPFAAEFTARYAGYTCQDVTHDFEKAFAAVRLPARLAHLTFIRSARKPAFRALRDWTGP